MKPLHEKRVAGILFWAGLLAILLLCILLICVVLA